MKQPQELMSMFIIPTIRNRIVKELKEQGLKQDYISKIFDMTPSAISNYMKNKRGNEIKICKNFEKEIKEKTSELFNQLDKDDVEKNKELVFKKINELSQYYRDNKLLCPLCIDENGDFSCKILTC